MGSAQGKFCSHGAALKRHFYGLNSLTYIYQNSLSGIQLQQGGKIPINSIYGLYSFARTILPQKAATNQIDSITAQTIH